MNSTDDIIAALERSLAASAPASLPRKVDRRWGLEPERSQLAEDLQPHLQPEPEPEPAPAPAPAPEPEPELEPGPDLQPEPEPAGVVTESELRGKLPALLTPPMPEPEVARDVKPAGNHRSPPRDQSVAPRLQQATSSSRQKQRAPHHFHRRRTSTEPDECENRPAAAPIDLTQFVQSPAAEALATLQRFNAEVEDQLVAAASAAACPETWTSWASTFHPELAEVQRPVSNRGAATTSGCVSLCTFLTRPSPRLTSVSLTLNCTHSYAQVAVCPAHLLEERRVLLLLRRQLNLSDELSTAQLRLLYGTNGANPGDKRRVRVLQLLKEVEQKLDGSVALTDGLSVEQLLQRAVQLATRVQQKNSAATLKKWSPQISAAVPRDKRKVEPETPWKQHVMQQEKTRHVNKWSGGEGGAGGAGGRLAGSAVLQAPKAELLVGKSEESSTAVANHHQEVDASQDLGDSLAAPENTAGQHPLPAVDQAIATNAALPNSDGLERSLKQQGRVSAWRCKDAARDVADKTQAVSAVEASVTAATTQSSPKIPNEEDENHGKISRRTPRRVSSRLYPGPASPSLRSPSGSASRTPKPRTIQRCSSSSTATGVGGSASLGSLSMASINSPRAGSSRGSREPAQQSSGSQSGARQKLSKLEQTLAELAAEADELLDVH